MPGVFMLGARCWPLYGFDALGLDDSFLHCLVNSPENRSEGQICGGEFWRDRTVM